MSYSRAVNSILMAFKGVFSDKSEEDLMNTEEYKEYGFVIIDCPVCGRKTMDSFWICSGCGWEYDFLIDYDKDESFSGCNGTTLGEYKNVYKLLKDAFDKGKNGEMEAFYIVTFTSKDHPDSIPAPHTFGAFESIEACRKALNENSMNMNMHLPLYDFCVVERIDMKANIERIQWFIWNEEKQGFFETEQKSDWSEWWSGCVAKDIELDKASVEECPEKNCSACEKSVEKEVEHDKD